MTKKSSWTDKTKAHLLGNWGKYLLGIEGLGHGMGWYKDGGRVKGCGVAKRGFGKAMKRKK